LTRLTSAQAIVKFLINEGVPYVLGIFGHGNVQLGEALKEHEDKIKFIQVKNEQNAVHIATAFARLTGKPLAVTSSIGPGCTNLVTGVAQARVNNIPVLVLPAEAFADASGPLLQQVEGTHPKDVLASNCLKPVSKYWVRLDGPAELMKRLPEAFEAMLDPSDPGPAVIALPMDSQAFSFDYDLDLLLKPRYRASGRIAPDKEAVEDAAKEIRKARRPFIIAGGGVIKSKAWDEVEELAELICAPVAQTHSSYGALLFDQPLNVYSTGPDGALCGNRLAKKADLIIGIGTKYQDFVDCSETLFRKDATFVNINISPFDVGKRRAVKLWGDAKTALRMLTEELGKDASSRRFGDYRKTEYFREIDKERMEWIREIERWTHEDNIPMTEQRVIGIVNEFVDERAVVVSAAGSLPGHLLRLWKCKDPTRIGFHCEFGYSTMGYEISAGIGIKLAAPDREVYVMIGDATFLMQPQELVTAVQENIAFAVLVLDNKGPQIIRHLQRISGLQEFANEFKYRDKNGRLEGEYMHLDYAKIAEGLACAGLRAENPEELMEALLKAKETKNKPTLIHVVVELGRKFLPGYEGWWNIPKPEVSGRPESRQQLEEYLKTKESRVIR